jgi:hypothetical protein
MELLERVLTGDMCMTLWKRKAIALFLLTIPCWTGVVGQIIHCTRSDAEKADYEASRLRTWDELYQSYLRYSGCDDGSIGEGYSDSVVRLLAHHWEALTEALPLFAGNTGFYKFVLKHIDPTTENNDLKLIRMYTVHSCPKGGDEICVQMRLAAERALSENGIVFHSQRKK